MRMALDVMQDSVLSWTIGYGEYQYPTYTIEAGGPKFMEFIEWLKRTPYDSIDNDRPILTKKEEPKDESISW